MVRRARTDGNVELLESLVETLSSSQFVTKRGLGVAYSAWIDVCCKARPFSKAPQLDMTTISNVFDVDFARLERCR